MAAQGPRLEPHPHHGAPCACERRLHQPVPRRNPGSLRTRPRRKFRIPAGRISPALGDLHRRRRSTFICGHSQIPRSNDAPVVWSHDDPYRAFEVWGYKVAVTGAGAGFTSLHDVSQTGLRVTTRAWAPDGPPIADNRITITTAALYQPGARYQWMDYNFASGRRITKASPRIPRAGLPSPSMARVTRSASPGQARALSLPSFCR